MKNTQTIIDSRIRDRLEEKLRMLNKLRPLPPASVHKLKEQFAVEMTYNSNAIEGNSLTLKETAWVIADGLTIKGKPLKDHLEAKDHYDAINHLYEIIEGGTRQTISEVFIRTMHRLVSRETLGEESGVYRSGNVMITGAAHSPPDVHKVPLAMRDMIFWCRAHQSRYHPVELAALVHHKLVFIHPFSDGNGRTARLVMNLLLMSQGFPLVIILKTDRRRYYKALARADQGEYHAFVRFVAQAVERSLNIYLKILSPTRAHSDMYLPLSTISKMTPYSEKYLNLLARYGKLAAHKEHRIWLTTKNAVEQYIQGRQRKRQLKRHRV